MTRSEECVRVVVRCRPMSSKEKSQGHTKIIDIDSKACSGMVMLVKWRFMHEIGLLKLRTGNLDSINVTFQ